MSDFAGSPARSVCSPTGGEELGDPSGGDAVLPNDQTIVSGWLKFRDNKKGVIRDNKTPLCGRRGFDEVDYADSPIVSRKFQQQDCACGAGGQKLFRAATHEGPAPAGSPMMAMRKRGESDCSGCMRKNIIRNQFSASVMKSSAIECGGSSVASSCENTPLLRRRDPFPQGSPAKSVLGEPGVFSSPVHTGKIPLDHHHGGFGFPGSPAKSVLGEPGVFSSPARSVCSPTGGEELGDPSGGDAVLPNDQTIVSGWLKFRDNKKDVVLVVVIGDVVEVEIRTLLLLSMWLVGPRDPGGWIFGGTRVKITSEGICAGLGERRLR
ncbi:conserved hypothetical protein [Culex quinquefasciatus]|uniref:Uncharacterized protein n=1 Tax=Culex quinquefasciatus TaxID=7176 RepID=B0WZJ6_CULQU|nr:conserved hypothetical protein [Culex quinquefasciatus]|eukprot:XP_001862818.1 conserved hypothetical protein [Culex quinquefasciatus]